MKRQPVEWEKTFASHVSDEGLMLKIGKELIQLHNNKRIIVIVLNMGKAPERLPCSPHGKESAYNAGEQGLIPGLARSLEKGMTVHFSILAWRIPWAEELGGLQSAGLQRVGHDWMTNAHKEPEMTLAQRHTNGQQVHGNVLNATNHQVNTDWYHNEISLAVTRRAKKSWMSVRLWRK